MKQITAVQGDTLDSIAQKYYGKTSGVVEQLFSANQHLDYSNPFIEMGSVVNLPVFEQEITTTINLWD